ncbi:hypothetical protein BGX28_008200 [Mortierella sp. GBA30]|nr:hypothetical protein BGX28_008200 [Mortierella sp. GBA30]
MYDIKGKFRISLHERKVFDISLLKQYCSSTCLAASKWLQSQLTEEPVYLKNSDPDHLKVSRVSIVPLDMELAQFQELKAKNGKTAETDVNFVPAFTLPTHNLDRTSVYRESSSTTEPTASSSAARRPSSDSSSSLSNVYVQSILAAVPETPSFIKIVEREPLDMSNMDQDMSEVFGTDRQGQEHDTVEGFRVPVDSKNAGKENGVDNSDSVRNDTNTIEQKMAQVTLSDTQSTEHQQHLQGDHVMRRSGSSMSMDTQP